MISTAVKTAPVTDDDKTKFEITLCTKPPLVKTANDVNAYKITFINNNKICYFFSIFFPNSKKILMNIVI